MTAYQPVTCSKLIRPLTTKQMTIANSPAVIPNGLRIPESRILPEMVIPRPRLSVHRVLKTTPFFTDVATILPFITRTHHVT